MRVVFWLVVRAVFSWLGHQVFFNLSMMCGRATSYAWNRLPQEERDRINEDHRRRSEYMAKIGQE